MKNLRVYLLSLFLILLAVSIITAKVIYGKSNVLQKYNPHLWHISIVMNLTGQGTRAKVRLTLPRENDRQAIYNEHYEESEMQFYIRERKITGNRIGFWRSELLDGYKTIQYQFSTQLRSMTYQIQPYVERPVKPFEFYPPEMHIWLKRSDEIQSDDPNIQKHLKKLIKKEKNVSVVVKKIFDFVRGEVAYKSEKGSKDAKATLDKLEADCGGKARLFAAMSRAAGIPSRLVGGLIMEGGMKNITHVWVEDYIGNEWIPFDVVNNHYAAMPDHYLELYRGDYALIKHTGLRNFEYFFVIGEEKVPPLDNPWSLYVLPLHFQGMIKVLLLIPLGALVVTFFRTIVGIQTFGTFTPILLSLAFRQVSLKVGILCLAVIIFTGWLLRKILDTMKILVIPRLAIVLTMVVIMVLSMMIIGFHFNIQKMLYMSLFPMVIMTWLIERFSVMDIEDGTKTALQTTLGTAFVAFFTYIIFGLSEVKAYLFAFPEILFIVMALLLLMGRYTGLRLTELWRFKDLLKAKRQNKQ